MSVAFRDGHLVSELSTYLTISDPSWWPSRPDTAKWRDYAYYPTSTNDQRD